jgi:hypothetical protein
MRHYTILLLSGLLLLINNPRKTFFGAHTPEIYPYQKDSSWAEIYTGKVFSSTCDGIDMTLKISKDYQTYELTESYRGARQEKETIQIGNLNTERGFGKDKNATVFVTDHDKQKSLQKYFVRLSKSPDELIMLSKGRKNLQKEGRNYTLKKIVDKRKND